ncbi:hypothetical protein [Comamonas thiooxydans]|uniref:hypothetical protein n=1 Tax=Comamonas thiooxydans TaxID=363952 RepID=UPI000B40EF68|nr:hypothetical protein [Comamonas thiooxydans]
MTLALNIRHGLLAAKYCKKILPLTVLQSNAGFYLGTASDEGPCSRESVEYWPTEQKATDALNGTEGVHWTQKQEP